MGMASKSLSALATLRLRWENVGTEALREQRLARSWALMWDDSGACEPDVARARGYACCADVAPGTSECEHAFLHMPAMAPRWIGQELLFDVLSPDEDDEGETWFFALHGTLKRTQPGPLKRWVDAWVSRVDGFGLSLTISEEACPDDERDELVREFVITREAGKPEEWVRPMCIAVRRPDPLFRLPERGRQLWFDARWPLPDGIRPLRVLTGSRASAGWTDLAPAHECLHHVAALTSKSSLVAALAASARPERWGGVVISRGGGGTPGDRGDWRTVFESPEVVAAVVEVQRTGLPVLVGLGHDADRTAVETVADFSWSTPSMLAETLKLWRQYLLAELASSPAGLSWDVYSAGRAVRQSFDDAWLRRRRGSGESLMPKRSWPGG